jgi:sulfatase modifying factor 1
MPLLSSFLLSALAAVASVLLLVATPAKAITIDFVPIGNPNNLADTTGYGAVSYAFEIMKFEFTNTQYAAFLNAIDPQGSNPQSVWNTSMGSSNQGGINRVLGNPVGSRYVVKTNFGAKPVNFPTVLDAARVANWLHNGAPVSPTTTDSSATAPQNQGAYLLGTATSGNLPAKSVGALYWIPLENEWYKAAYYNPTLNGGSGGYTLYGNGFGTDPGQVTADASGVGSVGGAGNFANWGAAANWNGTASGNVTTVATNGGESYYGLFDMSGNVLEFNTLDGSASSLVGNRGGSFAAGAAANISNTARRADRSTTFRDNEVGFRIAAVPEPETLAMLATGGAALVGGMIRRRRVAAKV